MQVAHIGYILAAYGVTALVLAGLVAWVVVDGRMQRAALDELDRRGVRRAATPRRMETAR